MHTLEVSKLSQTKIRYHGLDAVRSTALIIGIFHHGVESIISYAKWDWITQDSQNSLTLDIFFYVSHVFRMQAFFLLSGFFAHYLFSKLGSRRFIINRVKRLVLPFLIFWPLLYVATYRMWVWGNTYVHHYSDVKAISKIPDYMILAKGFPLMHLWFLYFLILFCAFIIPFKYIIGWIDRNETLSRTTDKFIFFCSTRWYGSLLIGLFMVAPMLGMNDGFGVDTSASGLVPRLAPFILYGIYFLLGWFFYRQPLIFKNVQQFSVPNLIASILLIIILIVINLVFSEATGTTAENIKVLLNALYTFASITSVFAFIGFMLRYFFNESAQVRYVADASYWGYLIHLPLVGFFQILVAKYDWFWGLKLFSILVPTFLLLFFSYKFLVRGTFVGTLLNGKREVKRTDKSLSHEVLEKQSAG